MAWAQLKDSLTIKFIPFNNNRELYPRLCNSSIREGNKDVDKYTREFQKLVIHRRFEGTETQRIIHYSGGQIPAFQADLYGQNFVTLDLATAHALNAERKSNLHKEIPQSRIETSKSSIVCYEYKGSKISPHKTSAIQKSGAININLTKVYQKNLHPILR